MSKNFVLFYGRFSVRFYMFAVILLTSLVMIENAAQARQSSLAKIHQKIEKTYPALRHLNGEEFSKLLMQDVLIFDVRKPNEYAVSHLEGAIQINPTMDGQTFISRYGSTIEGKKLVFYCSVGQRSSLMAMRVMEILDANEREQIYNLESGIFQWRNEDRPLMHEGDATRYVHPYNFYWGRLIEDRGAIRYKP